MTDDLAARRGIFGFFNDAMQTSPTFDPGLSAPCPICLRPVGTEPVKTISLMGEKSNRSYFFRAHKRCWEYATEDQRNQIEGSLIDSEERP